MLEKLLYYLEPRFTIFSVILSLFHGYYYGIYFLAILQSIILISGIIYHHNIIKCKIYRYIDILIVIYSLYYHMDYYNKCEKNSYLFLSLYLLGIVFYFVSLYTQNNKYHCGIHILPVLGNIVLHNLLKS